MAVLLVAASLALATPSAWAAPPPAALAPPDAFAELLLAAIGYARPARRFAGGVKLLALHSGGLSSRSLANDLAAAVRTRHDALRPGTGQATPRLFPGPDALRALIAEGGYNCVLLSTDLSTGQHEQIQQVTRELKVLSVAVEADAVRGGVSLGITLEERRLRLYVNRRAAQEEGVTFHLALLRHATLTGEEPKGLGGS